MKKTLSISAIVLLGLVLIFSQAFAFANPARLDEAKPTAKPNKTPEVESTQVEKDKGKPPEQAKGKSEDAKAKGKKYNFNGVVVSYASDALVIQDKKGETVTLVITADTLIKSGAKDGAVEIQAEMKVAVQASKADDGTLTALRIQVIPGKPRRIHRVGVVSAYDGSTITVQDAKGSTTFQVAPDVIILPAERAADLKVGARVTIISPRDPAGGTPVAKGIVIHPAQ